MKIKINLDKAKEIHANRIDLEAQQYLEDVKQKMLDAIIDGDKAAQISLKLRKKSLLDAKNDPLILSAKSVDELKRITPDIIKNYRLTKLK